jgi:hypothetical protein
LDAGHPYVKGMSSRQFSWNANYGGAYETGADATNVFFEVGEAVKSIAVYQRGGTAAIRIRSFQILSVDSLSAASWAGYEEIIPGCNIGTAAPTTGTWKRGDRCVNTSLAVGSPKAWSCTVTGTPGTWASEGNL